VQSGEQSLNHCCLEAIVDPRTCRRIETNVKIRAEDFTDGREDSKAGLAFASFDQREIAVVNSGCGGNGPLREVSVDAQTANVASNSSSELEDGSAKDGAGSRTRMSR
jgi:hypothetical protein